MTPSRCGLPIGGVLLLALAVLAPPARAQESWDAIYIAGKKVGYMNVRVESLKNKGHDLVRVRVDWVLSFLRGKDAVTIQMQYGTIEEPDGTVLRLETRTQASKSVQTIKGEVADGQMHLTFLSGGQAQQKVVPWANDVRGPYGAEMSLSRQPIKPGETRDVKTYIPELNEVCTTRLKAVQPEEIELGGGIKRTLLRVEATVLDSKGTNRPEMAATHWIDSGGQILKSEMTMFGGTTIYRTTQDAAMAPAAAELDLIAQTIVKVPRKITDPQKTRDVVYRVTLAGDDPRTIFPTDRRQTIRSGRDRHSMLLEVKTAGKDEGPAGPESVDPEYLAANPLVASTDSRVVALAQKAVGSLTDPWGKAVAITHWVGKNIQTKNFSTAFADAAEVARDLSGDCTEHSVLVAAMCRAVGVPARVAIGLIYADHLGGFGYHMWNEVYVNRRWVAVDAAFDQTEVDATHLKLSDTSLNGVSPYEAFLPVVRVSNGLTLEPAEVRRR
jgi:transglutaminase-like putative cysteine protease